MPVIDAVETILYSKLKFSFGNRPFIGTFGQFDPQRTFRSWFCKRPGPQPISSCEPLTGLVHMFEDSEE